MKNADEMSKLTAQAIIAKEKATREATEEWLENVASPAMEKAAMEGKNSINLDITTFPADGDTAIAWAILREGGYKMNKHRVFW